MGFFSFLDASTKESIRVDSDVSLHVPGALLGSVPEKFLQSNPQYRNLTQAKVFLKDGLVYAYSHPRRLYRGRYDGYGRIHIHTPAAFSGLSLDVHVCLYVMNAGALELPDVSTEEEARGTGLMIEMGSYYQDKDGNNHHYHDDPNRMGVKSTPFNGSFDTPQDPSGKTPNDLIQGGEWVNKKIVPTIPFPLKLTLEEEDKNGDRYKYEELNASEDCPNQGFFY